MAKQKILIVDDHPTNLEILRLVLEDEYELREATSGEDAIDLAVLFRPDLVLLDIMMPGIDGYETCRRLRSLEESASAKIVMVSAKAMASERLQGYDAGADDYITKPFDEEELLAKVRVFLELRRKQEVEAMKADVLELLNHELRTPLTTIKAPVEMLLSDLVKSETDRKVLLEMMATSCDRLDELIGKVLILCRLLAGQVVLDVQPVVLSTLINESLRRMQQKYNGRSIRFQTDLADCAEIKADEVHLSSVLDTVLDNAARFSPVDGVVQVSTICCDGEVRISVKDNGEGISPSFLTAMFDPFACPDVHLHAGGHGLSLSIAKLIVERHGGRIEASSGSDGTVISVHLAIPTLAAQTS